MSRSGTSIFGNRLPAYVAGLLRHTKAAFERDELTHTILLALAALGIAYLAALGIKVRATNLGEVWQWAAGLWIVCLFVFIAPYKLWLESQKKLDVFEEAARPKLTVSDPIEVTEPKGAKGKDVRSRDYRLIVKNESTALVTRCFVKMTSLVNANGHESDVLGMHFKLNTDQPEIIQEYDHRQTFDLPPGTHEIVAICGTNANVDEKQQMVIMLYAIHGAGGKGIRNAIPRRFFPHTLRIQICADNVAQPLERTYRLLFDEHDILRMEPVPLA